MDNYFTKPKITRTESDWFIWFRYNDRLIKLRKGINRLKDPEEKELFAQTLRMVTEDKLKKGWNPFFESQIEKGLPAPKPENVLLKDAFAKALEALKERVKPKTYSSYKGTVNFSLKAMNALFIPNIKVSQLDRYHVREILTKIKQQRSLTNNAYKKHLNHFKAICSELINLDLLANLFYFEVLNPPPYLEGFNPSKRQNLKAIAK